MILIFLLLLIVITVYKIRFGPNPEYLSHNHTIAINGAFVMIIFLSHSKGYLDLEGVTGRIYELFFAAIGQLLVVMFLFYSGYGLMEQYSHKKEAYLTGFIKKRVLKNWIHFAIAVIVYIILNATLSIRYPLRTIALSFIAWESIGNSNWYIFDILVLYFIFYLAMLIGLRSQYDKKWMMIIVWMFSLVIWGLLAASKERYWYDTLLAFPMGVTYSYLKPFIEKKTNDMKLWLVSIICLILAFSLFYFIIRGAVGVSISSMLFSLIVVLITMRVRIYNKALVFLGTHVFTIYVFQRIPMIILSHFGILQPMVFTTISLAVTLIFAVFFDLLFMYGDKALIKC